MHEQKEETSNEQEKEFSPSRRALLRAGWAVPVVFSVVAPANVFANASPAGATNQSPAPVNSGTGRRSQPPVFDMHDPYPGNSGNHGSGNNGNNGNHGMSNNGNHGMGNNGKRNK